MNRKKYYIYYHIDPRDRMPKYIGKGSGNRAWEFGKSRRNNKYINWIECLKKQGLKPEVFIGNKFNSEEECFKAEIDDISVLRKLGVDIKNISSGGGGVPLNEDIIKRRSEKHWKPVVCLNNNKKYKSIKECASDLKIDSRRVTDVLKARKKTYKGYTFRYSEEKLNKEPDLIRNKKNWV